MLQSRNLDNQTFDEMMEDMIGRLPFLSPRWTDYNAHDPGITILELMAWYQEMQRYHLNTVTPALERALLKLAGAAPRAAQPARCQVTLPSGLAPLPRLTRLETAEETVLELLEDGDGGAQIAAAYLSSANGLADVQQLLAQPDIAIAPFEDGGRLLLGLSEVQTKHLRLWVELADDYPVARNPFTAESQSPRRIAWEIAGFGPLTPSRDETFALSQSGYLHFELPENPPQTAIAPGGPAYLVLSAREDYAGCEESVRILTVSASRCEAVQQESWSQLSALTVTAAEWLEIALPDALSRDGACFAFCRTAEGLSQVSIARNGFDRSLWHVDTREAAQDGEPNLFVVSADGLRWPELFFDATGLPALSLQLSLGGRKLLTDRLILICDTLDEDGTVRPALWQYTDELSACGPRDRRFTYDADGERIIFGDGAHGAVPPKGEKAVLLAQAVLSHCEEGNLPAGTVRLSDGGIEMTNTAAQGGSAAESTETAAQRLRSRLTASRKCTSAADYEYEALHTPGLRVAAARAIPGYDPDEPAGKSNIPVVTVAVAPYSGAARPMPDQPFLDAVTKRLTAIRPVCTRLKVVPPRYVPIGLQLTVSLARGTAKPEALRQAAEDYFTLSGQRRIGDPAVKADLQAKLMAVEGVMQVKSLTLRPMGAGCNVSPAGDVTLPQNAVAYLAALELTIS